MSSEMHHEQCPWNSADPTRTRSVCGCPEGWPKPTDAPAPAAVPEPLCCCGHGETHHTRTAGCWLCDCLFFVSAPEAERNEAEDKMLRREAERDAALSRATEAEAYLRDISTILSDAGVLALTVRDGVIELRQRAECAEEDAEDSDGVRGRLADLLERVAIAFKGTPPPLTAWDWSDLPTLAADYKQRAEQAEAALAEARRLIQQVEWGGCDKSCPWCRCFEIHLPTCPAFGQQTTSPI